ncbi:hypothetical protein NDU88_001083 [Pleurodeles waltl]|uniref:Uncharacterized protein n=1 Tax=Pleurodeles waltl TaxID=8319 RepID=A0AAV7V8M0_PLEWA|nr:hypothetical protein NDU88_001083 [Pleurodeles waltl]
MSAIRVSLNCQACRKRRLSPERLKGTTIRLEQRRRRRLRQKTRHASQAAPDLEQIIWESHRALKEAAASIVDTPHCSSPELERSLLFDDKSLIVT